MQALARIAHRGEYSFLEKSGLYPFSETFHKRLTNREWIRKQKGTADERRYTQISARGSNAAQDYGKRDRAKKGFI